MSKPRSEFDVIQHYFTWEQQQENIILDGDAAAGLAIIQHRLKMNQKDSQYWASFIFRLTLSV